MNRFVIIIHAGTAEQNDAVTSYAVAKGWHFWHWVENVWFFADVPGDVTPRALWEEIMRLPWMRDVKGLVFRLGAEPSYWGGNAPDSWEWLARFWGAADLPG